MMNKNRQNESGNVLWFILLAIALLAALTATISKSSDTTEQNANIERFRIDASDIMRHSASIREAVNSLKLQGISENNISFVNTSTSVDYSNGTCFDCMVFSSSGGGAAYRTPNPSWLDSTHSGDARYGEWEFSGTNDVIGVRSANADLIMYLGYLKENLCTQINTMLRIAGTPTDAGFDQTAFTGSFANTADIGNMSGAESGCFEDTSGDRDFTYYQVLIKR
ncbi:MAG: hypothetical protein H6867_06120 [Rhodospirillales bacterium]|nr:hypothetical protein [Rhodospirillales bacterium]MCB9995105.1 hypothetical protein [Rhodospirillales bacterium]